MKKISLETLLIIIIVFTSYSSIGQTGYYPVDSEIPPAGKATRVGPMKVIAFVEPSLNLNVSDAEKEYYGYLEFGESFLNISIYHKVKGHQITYVDMGGTKLVSKGRGKTQFTKDEIEYQQYINGVPVKTFVKIKGCPINLRPYCYPSISLSRIINEKNSSNLKEALLMSYDYIDKVNK